MCIRDRPVADSHSIPTGVYEEVAGTPMDFRTAKQIGQDIEAEFDQLNFTGGYLSLIHILNLWQWIPGSGSGCGVRKRS